MAITIIDGDLFTTEANVICHQTNCQGVMGSGVAKGIKERYPEAYRQYRSLCNKTFPKDKLLGHAQAVHIYDEKKTIYNLFGQEKYGYDGKQYTSHEALEKCFKYVVENKADGDIFAMPYRIGCDRGGGDWNIVYKMIEDIFVDCEVILYRWKG